MFNNAVFSESRDHRFALWRIWDNRIPYAMFIGRNPSHSDELRNDRTLNKCIAYAKTWGYGGVCLGNLFSFVASGLRELKEAPAPVDPENDRWIEMLARNAGVVIAAWGNSGSFRGRDKEVLHLLPNVHVLTRNKSGQPSHLLYSKIDLIPKPLDK
jgi:hypothetical protein